jgi:cyclohexyl-isocyanide hydratase
VTSVCTGSLVLAAAGLLQGYRATTHWLSMELLPLCGATSIAERVVVDGNRITGAGVTSGIDMALKAASLAFDEDTAREIQLRLEYKPEPPFVCGAPAEAPVEMVERVTASMAEMIAQRRIAMERAAVRLRAR